LDYGNNELEKETPPKAAFEEFKGKGVRIG
jgi:hypothetical protein